jgi:release factor glutamine methyltransferase
LDLQVSPATLIPRPETERLVEVALERLPASSCKAADLGTGSGAIALALASERPNWNITGTDISAAALDIARDNAKTLKLASLTFLASDWFEDLPERDYELIISNPPYIPNQDPHLDQGDVRFEPQSALTSGADGLQDLRQLIASATEYLHSNGWLMLEHGYDQAKPVAQLFNQAGFTSIQTYHDLAQQPRVTIGRSNVIRPVADV